MNVQETILVSDETVFCVHGKGLSKYLHLIVSHIEPKPTSEDLLNKTYVLSDRKRSGEGN